MQICLDAETIAAIEQAGIDEIAPFVKTAILEKLAIDAMPDFELSPIEFDLPDIELSALEWP